jgi:hypothetical protein
VLLAAGVSLLAALDLSPVVLVALVPLNDTKIMSK